MSRSPAQLREDAVRIWQAGLDGVRSPRLIFNAAEVDYGVLRLGDEFIDLAECDRICVVGGGKAAAGMAVALEQALGPTLLHEKKVCGCVNVPADCLLKTDAIELRAGRPAGINEPTPAGEVGVGVMLELVSYLGPRDLCLCLLSGGASALMPAPIAGISLQEKQELTRAMSERGATIHQMNAVRRALSRIKGGGLARACRAGRLVSLIISDVPGDDLATIGSGPTVLGPPPIHSALEALEVLSLGNVPAGARALALLRDKGSSMAQGHSLDPNVTPQGCRISNVIIGNNATAVDAAGVEAERLGYSHAMTSSTAPEGLAEGVAEGLVTMAIQMRSKEGPDCLITGGEPTMQLAPAELRGHGGRNQQLALAALAKLEDWTGVALISGGTDGEDGPTDAAGALVDEGIADQSRRLNLDPRAYLARNDAYRFFQQSGGLVVTGPTHTNVCDLRVVTVSR